MSDSSPTPITTIADTAFWVAAGRARESERSDALFHDPYARLLVGERGETLLEQMGNPEILTWSVAIRTRVLDEMLMQSIQQQGCDTVLSLAAGLDSRPYRMALPSSLHWIEVDLPTVLTYKEEVLVDARPTCALEQVKMDLAERTARQELFQRINAQAARVLVLTEGLLAYLTQEQVVQLIEDLHDQPHFHWLLNTSGPSQVLRFLQRLHGRQLAQGNSALHLLSEDENALFWSLGWKVATFRSMLAESEQFKRAWPSAVTKFVGESAETREALYQKGGMTLYTRV